MFYISCRECGSDSRGSERFDVIQERVVGKTTICQSPHKRTGRNTISDTHNVLFFFYDVQHEVEGVPLLPT